MKANELRIGNYVWDDYSGEMIVSAILESSAVYLRKTIALPSGQYLIKDIEPIPLTEEWLLKFGFIIYHKTSFYELVAQMNHFTIYTNSTGKFCFTLKGFNIHFEYIHQLQNFYFALTGQELTIQ